MRSSAVDNNQSAITQELVRKFNAREDINIGQASDPADLNRQPSRFSLADVSSFVEASEFVESNAKKANRKIRIIFPVDFDFDDNAIAEFSTLLGHCKQKLPHHKLVCILQDDYIFSDEAVKLRVMNMLDQHHYPENMKMRFRTNNAETTSDVLSTLRGVLNDHRLSISYDEMQSQKERTSQNDIDDAQLVAFQQEPRSRIKKIIRATAIGAVSGLFSPFILVAGLVMAPTVGGIMTGLGELGFVASLALGVGTYFAVSNMVSWLSALVVVGLTPVVPAIAGIFVGLSLIGAACGLAYGLTKYKQHYKFTSLEKNDCKNANVSINESDTARNAPRVIQASRQTIAWSRDLRGQVADERTPLVANDNNTDAEVLERVISHKQ